MQNKKKILNEGEGEISLALIGLILKKIKKVAFKVVYEKLLKDGDEKASDFFKEDGVAENFQIQNYEDLLNLKEIGEKPSAKPIGMKPDTVQINKLTSEEHDVGKKATERLDKLVKSDEKDKSLFDNVKSFLYGMFGIEDEEGDEEVLPELEEGSTEDEKKETTDEEARETLKKLIYKYDPLKDVHNTHIFPFTDLETYFVKKRTGLEKVYTIQNITQTVARAAITFHELKKIRLTILKVQKASRELHGQKVKSDDKEIKTIGDIIAEEVVQQTSDPQTDNLIKAFVADKGKIGLNPFAIADELLYSVYGENELKEFMKDAEDLHDELNEVSKYVLKVFKSRKLDTSGDEENKETGDLKAAEGEQVIKNALEIYTKKIEAKYKFKKDGQDTSVSPQITNVLDVLVDAIVKSFSKEEITDSAEDEENPLTEIFSRSDDSFDKFAKKVEDRINNLKLPGKIEDKRSLWTKFKDLLKGKTNIDSILRNAYEKGGIKEEDKKVFEKILKTDKFIGEDEIQYMVMRILLEMKKPEEIGDNTPSAPEVIVQDDEEVDPESEKIVIDSSHYNYVRQILSEFLNVLEQSVDFEPKPEKEDQPTNFHNLFNQETNQQQGDQEEEQNENLLREGAFDDAPDFKNDDSEDSRLNFIPDEEPLKEVIIEALKGYGTAGDFIQEIEPFRTAQPGAVGEVDEYLWQAITKALGEINFLQNYEEDAWEEVVSRQFEDYFQNNLNLLFSLRLSCAFATKKQFKDFYEAQIKNPEGRFETQGHILLSDNEGEPINAIVKQNIRARIDFSKLDEKQHANAKRVEGILIDLLEITKEVLVEKSSTNESVFGRYTASGAEKTFIEKLAKVIWIILRQTGQWKDLNFERTEVEREDEESQIRLAIYTALDRIQKDEKKEIINFYKISFGKKDQGLRIFGKGFTPKLFGDVIKNVTKYIFNPLKKLKSEEEQENSSGEEKTKKEEPKESAADKKSEKLLEILGKSWTDENDINNTIIATIYIPAEDLNKHGNFNDGYIKFKDNLESFVKEQLNNRWDRWFGNPFVDNYIDNDEDVFGYFYHMESGAIHRVAVESKQGDDDQFIEFFKEIKNKIEPEEEPADMEEKLAKLIKPLIREKLKRKQNGKKNLRN